MEIKVLGTGCSSCKAFYETTKQAISELGCDATLIKEEDLLKIMEYNILGLPALVIAVSYTHLTLRKTKRKKYSLTALKFSIFMERNDVSLAGRLKPIQ